LFQQIQGRESALSNDHCCGAEGIGEQTFGQVSGQDECGRKLLKETMNHPTSKVVLGLASAISLIGLTGCVYHERVERPRREVVIEERRPREEVIMVEERVEVIPVRPSGEHVWIKGHWYRAGNHWQWANGHWEIRPRRSAEWAPGRWEHRGHGYVWIEGHWR